VVVADRLAVGVEVERSRRSADEMANVASTGIVGLDGGEQLAQRFLSWPLPLYTEDAFRNERGMLTIYATRVF